MIFARKNKHINFKFCKKILLNFNIFTKATKISKFFDKIELDKVIKEFLEFFKLILSKNRQEKRIILYYT